MEKIALISHGCAKNLVDSELILGILSQNDYQITLNESEADTVIVNTCSFISDAERESIQSILQMADANKKIIVTGCLSQKHADELKEAIPEISAVIGTTDFTKIIDVLNRIDKEDFVNEVSKEPNFIINISCQCVVMLIIYTDQYQEGQ